MRRILKPVQEEPLPISLGRDGMAHDLAAAPRCRAFKHLQHLVVLGARSLREKEAAVLLRRKAGQQDDLAGSIAMEAARKCPLLRRCYNVLPCHGGRCAIVVPVDQARTRQEKS